MDDSPLKTYDEMKYKRLMAPVLESISNAEGVMVTAPADSRYRAQYEKYVVKMAAWKGEHDLCSLKHSMDGMPVSMAIAAVCGPQISPRIGQQFQNNAGMQPDEPGRQPGQYY